jgi:NTP pyrophosphatase (non-canonical NTP hydrolase)
MDFLVYQRATRKTAIYPKKAKVIYPALGIAGEAGEVAEKIKKQIRDFKGDFNSSQFKIELIKELGDVLWYIANLAYDLNIPLNLIARTNLDKLAKRQKENKLHGKGDNR